MKKLSLILVVLLLAAGMAFAQKEGEGKFGLLLKILPQSYDDVWLNLELNPYLGPPSLNLNYQEIGIVYHINPLISIKPMVVIGFPGYKATVNGVDYEDFKATAFGATVAVDFTFLRPGDVSIFAGPLVRLIRISSELKDLTVVPNDVYELTDFEISIIASMGGQYMFGKRFGVWGRAGLGFTHVNFEYTEPGVSLESKANVVFTYQGSLGIVFYIK